MKKIRKSETRHIIAILDLLGASEMIQSNGSEEVMNYIFDSFQSAEAEWPYVKNAPSTIKDIKFVTFSDNITMALELPDQLTGKDMKTIVEDFIRYISVFQGALSKKGLFFRGGIAIGKLYMDSKMNFVWGEALVKAHVLEEKTAIYPRVVLSSQIAELNLSSSARVLKDFDGIHFVDYFSKIKEIYPEWIEEIKKIVTINLNKYRENERILQKYAWLEHYLA